MRVVRAAVVALRAVGLTVVLIAGLLAGAAVTAAAADVENLMVPSAAMGRDIPVTFLGGGPHAVFLLDAFNAGDAVSNWVTAGNAMNTLAGKGVSVVAPAGGGEATAAARVAVGVADASTLRARSNDDWLAVGDPSLDSGDHRGRDVAAAHRGEDETARNLARCVEKACVRPGGGENDVDGSRQSIRGYYGGRGRHLTS